MIDYETFLKAHRLWPMDVWNRFEFVHQCPSDRGEERANFRRLREIVAQTNGLYAYRLKNAWLYVGKGKPLFERLKIHYQSCHKQVSGDTKDQRWHRFFKEYCGELTVYWIEVEPETDRRVFELILTHILTPKFIEYR